MVQSRDHSSALRIFKKQGGTLRTAKALSLGIHPATLYTLRDDGRLVMLARGVYRLADAPESSNPDLALIASRVPDAAVCLISALAFHDITTQIPAAVHLAVPRGKYHKIRLGELPVQTYRYDAATFAAGLEPHLIGGKPIRVYNVARTIADCFKFRNKIGLDVALEALRLSLDRKRMTQWELFHYARLLRVERVIQSYVHFAR